MRTGARRLLLILVLTTIAWLTGRGSTPEGIVTESEEMLAYLTRQHPDFLRMKVVLHSQREDGQWRYLLTADGSRVLDSFVLHVEDGQRSLFESLSSPVLRPRNPAVNPTILSWLGVAWYWDYRVLKNPALVDPLADTMRGVASQNITKEEARAFWYYRYQLAFHRNRRALHQSWIHHPDRLQRLSPEEAWADEALLGVYAFVDLRMSPILSPFESLELLHALQNVPLCCDDAPVDLSTEPFALSGSGRNTPLLLLQNRIDFIRQWILHINPVAMNALRSLGIAYEHALLENHAEVQKAWIQYLEDFKLVEEVVRFLSVHHKCEPKGSQRGQANVSCRFTTEIVRCGGIEERMTEEGDG